MGCPARRGVAGRHAGSAGGAAVASVLLLRRQMLVLMLFFGAGEGWRWGRLVRGGAWRAGQLQGQGGRAWRLKLVLAGCIGWWKCARWCRNGRMRGRVAAAAGGGGRRRRRGDNVVIARPRAVRFDVHVMLDGRQGCMVAGVARAGRMDLVWRRSARWWWRRLGPCRAVARVRPCRPLLAGADPAETGRLSRCWAFD